MIFERLRTNRVRGLRPFLAAGSVMLARSAIGLGASGVGAQPAQADSGGAIYRENCAACHGDSLRGAGHNPALTGSLFANHWNSKSSDDLASYIAMNMPPGQGGTLSDREYRDITGFILRANGQQAAGTIAIKSENVAPSSPSQPNDKRKETHTSELQELIRRSYALFCLHK